MVRDLRRIDFLDDSVLIDEDLSLPALVQVIALIRADFLDYIVAVRKVFVPCSRYTAAYSDSHDSLSLGISRTLYKNVMCAVVDDLKLCAVDGCIALRCGLACIGIDLSDLKAASEYIFSYRSVSQIDDHSVFPDGEILAPRGVQVITRRSLRFLYGVRTVWERMSIGCRDAILVRCDDERSVSFCDLFASDHNRLLRLVAHSEFSSLKGRIALCIGLIELMIDLRKLDTAADDRLIAFEFLVVGLDMQVVCAVLSDMAYDLLIIKEIAFRCLDLADHICAERISDFAVLVLVEG